MTAKLLESALWYARKGWPVLPLHTPTGSRCSCGRADCGTQGKHPRYHHVDLPSGAKSATTDEATIKQWWNRWPTANVGIATGVLSFDVLDIDKYPVDGEETLHSLETKHGKVPDTVEQITGSGGRQVMFQPTNGGLQNAVKFAPGLDIRTDGGLVVVPPSLHVSGHLYEWELSSRPEETELAPWPGWLLAETKKSLPTSGPKVDAESVLDGVPEGERDNTLFKYACSLEARGVIRAEAETLVSHAAANCSPPFSQVTALKKVEQAWKYREEPLPVAVEDTSASLFPTWVMAGVAGNFAELHAQYMEAPAEFFYMSFLVAMGSALSETLTLASEVGPQPRFYMLLLGESADDRKSTAIAKTVDFVRDAIDGFQVSWGIGSPEGLQKRLEQKSQLLVCFDEFRQFVSKATIQNSVLLPCFNTLFELNRYENTTKTTDIRIDGAHLSLLAASTLDTFENTWKSQFTDIGFNNRLWLVPGSGGRKFSFPVRVPDKDKYLIRQELWEVLRHVGSELDLDIAPEAREVYHEWYMNRDQSIHSKRLDTYAMRFMSILAVNELKTEIDLAIVEKVIALADWQLAVRRELDPIDAESNIARMEERIRRHLAKGPTDDRSLRQYTNAKRVGLWVFNQAQINLQKAGDIGWNRKTKEHYLKKV